ncbi:MAG TPA: hypothetical protein VGU72_04295 [Beijerinckiaceae bacterium]|jgi:hypothetical protein|nr:hypothetical protein [Beijerinckiaceae bacterium]
MPILEGIEEPSILSTAASEDDGGVDVLAKIYEEGGTPGLVNVFQTARRRAQYDQNFNGREAAMADVVSDNIRTLKTITGQELEDPFSGGYDVEARQRFRDTKGHYPDGTNAEDRYALSQLRLAVFEEKMQALKDQHQIADSGTSVNTRAKLLAQQAIDDADRAYAGSKGSAGPFVAQLAGGMAGSFRDPIQLVGLLAGGGQSKAVSVFGKVVEGAFRQGAVNAGLQILSEPAVQQWRADRGRENGILPAAEDVGMAFLFGAAFGGGFEGARAAMRGRGAVTPEMVQKAASGDLESASTIAKHLPPEEADILRAAIASERSDRRAMGKPPPGVSEADHAQAFREAVRFADDPVNNPPPEPPPVAREEQFSLFADDADPSAPVTYLGKPVGAGRFDPLTIGTDAAAFQYKGGGDHAGVTDRLKFIERWDPLASGKAMVFERGSGDLVIADGHQRLGLARRLRQEDPGADIMLDAFRFREADGWTPQDVRAIAARKNIQEGSGDAIDTARILRERPDLWDGTLPVTDPKIRQARGLAMLSDDAWGMVLNNVVPPNWAQHVGTMAPNPTMHAALMDDLIKFAPQNEAEARIVIGEAMSAGVSHETQMALFGQMETTRTLMRERIKTLSAAQKLLTDDARIFGLLVKEAQRIEGAGNRLIDANAGKADQARLIGDIIDRLARRAGPISDALNDAARALQQNPRDLQGPARRFVDQVADLVEREGIVGLDRPRFLDAPRQAPEVPTGPEARAQIEALQPVVEKPAGEGTAPAAKVEKAPPTVHELMGDGSRGGDMFELTPFVDDMGQAGKLTADGAVQIGEREARSADIIKVCAA